MSSITSKADLEPRSAVEILIQAYQEGRPIIPFLGAGVSVGTGFPSMTAITNYLAKVRYYIRHVVPEFDDFGGSPEADYLRCAGWPDIHRLNAEVWESVKDHKDDKDKKRVMLVYEQLLDKTLRTLEIKKDEDKDESEALKLLCDLGITGNLSKIGSEYWTNHPNSRPELAAQHQILQMAAVKDVNAAKALLPEVLKDSVRESGTQFLFRGDWYDLLMSLTAGDFALVDLLFHTLGRNRRPGSTHVFLAQLADSLRVRLYLSLNFDPFLEEALWDEGHQPNVIEVAKDSDLPSPSAVRDRLTVLKLHGGPYGLRIGERINEKADPNTLHGSTEIIPTNALILVMGFSGEERRIREVLIQHCKQAGGRPPAMVWMNFGKVLDKPLERFQRQVNGMSGGDGQVVVRSYDDPAQFLLRLIARLRGAYPSGIAPYRCLATKPSDDQALSLPPERQDHLWAFYRKSDWEKPEDGGGHCDATVAMAQFCAAKRNHHIIWIDCEQHHTVEGVVTDILDTIRGYDPTFAPLHMQTTEEKMSSGTESLQRPVERIREALQRGNYVLCIDSPEAIGRAQTMNHGTPTMRKPDSANEDDDQIKAFDIKVKRFFEFLSLLLVNEKRGDIGESYIAIAMAPPSPRHSPEAGKTYKTLETVQEVVKGLRKELEVLDWEIKSKESNRYHIEKLKAASNPVASTESAILRTRIAELLSMLINDRVVPTKSHNATWMLALSVCRRPRSPLMLRALFEPLGGSDGSSAAIWNWTALGLNADDKFHPDFPQKFSTGERTIGGGLLWLPRRKRNTMYKELTEEAHVFARKLREAKFRRPWSPDDIEGGLATMKSLLVCAILHRRAARFYFSEVYEASHDIAAFREYLYHRVTYLRYLCRLLGVALWWDFQLVLRPSGFHFQKDTELRETVRKAINNYHEMHREAGEGGGPRLPDPDLAWTLLRNELRGIWLIELNALRATLSREFNEVRQRLFAGTWIDTIDRIIQLDADEMYDEKSFHTRDGDKGVLLCKMRLDGLLNELRRQRVQCQIEMADWPGAVEATNQRLKELPINHKKNHNHNLMKHVLSMLGTFDDVLKGKKPTMPDMVEGEIFKAVKAMLPLKAAPTRTPGEFVDAYNYALEVSRTFLQLARTEHELVTGTTESKDAREAAWEAARRTAGLLKKFLDQVEAFNVEKGKKNAIIPPFSKDILLLMSKRIDQHRLEVAAARAQHLLDDAEAEDNSTLRVEKVLKAEGFGRWLVELARKTVSDDLPTYNRYRVKSLRIRATARLSEETPDYERIIADIELALRLYRVGRVPGPFEAVACYLAKAEAFRQSSTKLFESSTAAARSRLDSAGTALRRAASALQERPRNVLWSRRINRARIEWAITSCMLHANELVAAREPAETDAVKQKFDRDLRYGLDAIRAGLDNVLPVRNGAANQLAPKLRSSTRYHWSQFVAEWEKLKVVANDFWARGGQDRKGDPWGKANMTARLDDLWKTSEKDKADRPETLYTLFSNTTSQDS